MQTYFKWWKCFLGPCEGDNRNSLDNDTCQRCADNDLFLSSLNFGHISRRTAKWRSDTIGSLNQIDHIPLSCRLCGCVISSKSYLTMFIESDDALVFMRFLLQLNDHRRRLQTWLMVERLSNSGICTIYERKSSDEQRTPPTSNADERWSLWFIEDNESSKDLME